MLFTKIEMDINRSNRPLKEIFLVFCVVKKCIYVCMEVFFKSVVFLGTVFNRMKFTCVCWKVHRLTKIIIIMSCRQHGYPWPSLATSPYYSSPLAGLQGYILYPHIAAECMFELVILFLLGHMWGSIGVHHLWACPCFSSSVLRVCFV